MPQINLITAEASAQHRPKPVGFLCSALKPTSGVWTGDAVLLTINNAEEDAFQWVDVMLDPTALVMTGEVMRCTFSAPTSRTCLLSFSGQPERDTESGKQQD